MDILILRPKDASTMMQLDTEKESSKRLENSVDFEEMTVNELKELAGVLDIEIPAKVKKEEIIKIIRENEA